MAASESPPKFGVNAIHGDVLGIDVVGVVLP
jgi:hypothetical protein